MTADPAVVTLIHTVSDSPLYTRIRTLLEALETGLFERTTAVRVSFLAAVAGESVFFLGPPGVAKSLIARRIKHAFAESQSFEYLMGRFSTPEEIFGPISLKRLKEADSYERLTERYLPEADVVFLDEIWKASPPIQNALLTALNERLFRNGAREIHIPLKLVVAASNEVPDTHLEQAAFWDRFLLRIVLEPIGSRDSFRRLIADDHDPYTDPVPAPLKISNDEYREWSRGVSEVAIPEPIGDLLWAVAASIRAHEELSDVSDRRWKKIARLLRASAFLHGRSEVSVTDCGVIVHAIWDDPTVRGSVEEVLSGALAEYDHGWNADLLALKGELERAETELTSSVTEETVAEVDVPRLYRGEYYRLLDHPFDGSVLIWKSDFERLDEAEAMPCDLFYYTEDDQYSHTESIFVRREDTAVETPDGLFAIEVERRTERVVEQRGTSEDEMRHHHRHADRLRSAVARILAEASDYRQILSDEAEHHLFLSPAARHAILAGIDRVLERAGEMELSVRRHAERVAG